MSKTRTEATWDAVVVGGGAIGLACAWRAAQRGLRIRVLAGRPGPASDVAAGMLAPVTEVDFGEQDRVELNLRAAAAYPAFVVDLEEAAGVGVGYRPSGALYAALDRDEAEELRRLHALHDSLGLDAPWLRASACRELEPGLSPACAGGIHARGDASVDPSALRRALRLAATRAGVVIEEADATGLVFDGDRVAGVESTAGRVAAEQVVIACGAWSGSLDWLPAAARVEVRPVKGQIVTLRGPADDPVCERVVRTRWVYVVPRADGRVVVGATVEERGFDTTVTAGAVLELLREAYRALPDIAELELVDARAGLRPGTPDNRPVVGPTGVEGLFVATGHYRNGILLTPVTADVVAASLAGEPSELFAGAAA